MTDGLPYRLRQDGADLFVRLTPKAARDAIDGIGHLGDGRCHLQARVRAVPKKGKANSALLRLLADEMNLPLAGLSVASGATARLKTVHVRGDPAPLERLVARLAAGKEV